MKKTLKITALLLCAVAMLMTSSCTKENGNQGNNDYQSRILGKWKVSGSNCEYDLYFKTEYLLLSSWNPFQKQDDYYYEFAYIIDDNELNIGSSIYDGHVYNAIVYNILELTNSKLVLLKENGHTLELFKVN